MSYSQLENGNWLEVVHKTTAAPSQYSQLIINSWNIRPAARRLRVSLCGGWSMTYRGLIRVFTLFFVISLAQLLLADTTASTTAQANNSSDSKSYDLCPVGPCYVAVSGASSLPNQGTIQSQASDGGASAEAHVDLGT